MLQDSSFVQLAILGSRHELGRTPSIAGNFIDCYMGKLPHCYFFTRLLYTSLQSFTKNFALIPFALEEPKIYKQLIPSKKIINKCTSLL